MRSINVLRMPSRLQTDNQISSIIARSLTIHEQLTPLKRKFGIDSDSSATGHSGPPPKPVFETAKTKGVLSCVFFIVVVLLTGASRQEDLLTLGYPNPPCTHIFLIISNQC